MRAIISAKELRNGLKTLKSVAECFLDGKAETVYGFNKDERGLWLQAVGGVFVSYLVSEKIESFESFVPIDAGTLSSLKFPADEVCFEKQAASLKLTSGALDVELPLLSVQVAAVKAKEVPLTLKLPVKPLIKALAFHCYGSHHNPLEAAKRPVRLEQEGGKLRIQSFDKQVSAFNSMPFAGELSGSIHLTPKPLKTVLENVEGDEVQFGTTKQYWKVSSPRLEVTFPNLLKPVTLNFDSIIEEMKQKPSIKIAFARDYLSKTLNVLSPSVKAGKEENPKMHFFPRAQGVQVTVASEKIKSMKFDLDGQVDQDRMTLDGSAVALNYRYTREFVDNLDGDEVHFQYWKFQDQEAPLNGRAVSFFNETGRYIIARISL